MEPRYQNLLANSLNRYDPREDFRVGSGKRTINMRMVRSLNLTKV